LFYETRETRIAVQCNKNLKETILSDAEGAVFAEGFEIKVIMLEISNVRVKRQLERLCGGGVKIL